MPFSCSFLLSVLCKVETTGDSYMMAAGLPGTATDHAQSVTDMAFDMRNIIEEKDVTTGTGVHADLEVLILLHFVPQYVM